MHFPFYIARRYLFAKKSRNVINIISGISMFVVAAVAAAMLTVLSAINGIDGLVRQLFTSFDAPITITPLRGKVFSTDSLNLDQVRALPEVLYLTRVLEDDVILGFEDRKTVATLRGVDSSFTRVSPVETMLYAGEFVLEEAGYPYAVVGLGIRSELRLPVIRDERPPLQIFAPIRGKNLRQYRERAFNKENILVSGVYSVNADLDVKYVITSYDFAAELFDYGNAVSSLELGLSEDTDPKELQEKLQLMLGDQYVVQTREDKNALIFKTNASEKWATYAILMFILLIAAFNIIASLTMLVIEKKKDIFILRSMGAREEEVRKVFFLEGVLINLIGATSGLVVGFGLCMLQQHFGLVRLQGSIVDFYPIEVRAGDVLIIFSSIMLMGLISSNLLVRYLIRRHAAER